MESEKDMKRNKGYFWIARDPSNGLWSNMVHFFVYKPVITEDEYGIYWSNPLKTPVVDYLQWVTDFNRLFKIPINKGECKKIRLRRSYVCERPDIYIDFQYCNWKHVDPAPLLFILFFDKNFDFQDKMPYSYFVEYTGVNITFKEMEDLEWRNPYIGLPKKFIKLKAEEV